MWGRKTKQQPADAAPDVTIEVAATDTKPVSPAAPRRHPLKTIAIICGTLVIIGVLAILVLQAKQRSDERRGIVTIPSEQTFLTNREKDLLAEPPAATAQLKEKLAYYDELTLTHADQKEYTEAVASFATREALSVEGLDYFNYVNAARYAHEAKDDSAALGYLTKAKALVEKRNFDGSPIEKSRYLDYLEKLRMEYAK